MILVERKIGPKTWSETSEHKKMTLYRQSGFGFKIMGCVMLSWIEMVFRIAGYLRCRMPINIL